MFVANQRGCLRFVESKVSIRTSKRAVCGCCELKKIQWPTTVTAISNTCTSRRKEKTHGKNKSSLQNQKAHGKTKKLTAKPKSSQQNQKAHSKTKSSRQKLKNVQLRTFHEFFNLSINYSLKNVSIPLCRWHLSDSYN